MNSFPHNKRRQAVFEAQEAARKRDRQIEYEIEARLDARALMSDIELGMAKLSDDDKRLLGL